MLISLIMLVLFSIGLAGLMASEILRRRCQTEFKSRYRNAVTELLIGLWLVLQGLGAFGIVRLLDVGASHPRADQVISLSAAAAVIIGSVVVVLGVRRCKPAYKWARPRPKVLMPESNLWSKEWDSIFNANGMK
jgi:uncharacterized membrane protein